jgi:hypothetical protein
MQARALAVCLAVGLAGVMAACGDDSNKRHAREGDAGAADGGDGSDAGGPGSNAGG